MSQKGESAGQLRAYAARPGNSTMTAPHECRPLNVEYADENGTVIMTWLNADEGISVKLTLNSHASGHTGILSAEGKGHAVIRIVWELPDEGQGFTFVPGFMYGNNAGGNSPDATYPMLFDGSNGGRSRPWVSKEWMVRTDRSTHGFSSVICPANAYSLGGRDTCKYADGAVAEKTGISTRSYGPHRLSFSLGFINSPFTYSPVVGRNFFSRPEGFVDLDKGMAESDVFMIRIPSEGILDSSKKLLRTAYGIQHDKVVFTGSLKDAITDIADALVKYGYDPDVKDFYVEIHNDKGMMKRKAMFNSAWTGGARTAWPLLAAERKVQNETWHDVAVAVISNIAEKAISQESGLFFENFDPKTKKWNTRGWWTGMLEKPAHSGMINGEICYYLLLAYESEIRNMMKHKTWLASVRSVMDRLVATQLDNGSFGYLYSEEDGSILDSDGFGGCWIVPALALLYIATQDKKYLSSALKAMDFYRTFIEKFELHGGPMDTCKSPDEEGVLAWIKAARILHEITRDKKYLSDLINGLEYEFSWKFSYNVVNEIEPLKSANWHSTGGSVTSVNNSHVHPMGGIILDEIIYAYETTGDGYFKKRAADTLNWTLNSYLREDGFYGWGFKGQINERFCYTDSTLLERYPDGSPASTWFCGHSWASGSVLECLAGVISDSM